MMTNQEQRVLRHIREAFAGVTLGDGVGLHQAQGIDRYADARTLALYRAQDEKLDWSAIPVADLDNCYSSLSFFDAEGMRFHLPAYLVADLEDKLRTAIILFHLYGRAEQFDKLSDAQRDAVREFLLVRLGDSDWEAEHPAIEEALREHWVSRKRSESPMTYVGSPHLEQLQWLLTELLNECRRARNSAIVPEFLALLDEVDRETMLGSLFAEALLAREWWLAEDCLANGLSLAPKEAYEPGTLNVAMQYLGDSPDVIAWLLDHGAQIEERGGAASNATPLMCATSLELTGVVELLLRRGADPNASRIIDDDDTALMLAAKIGNRKIVELLLAYGAQVSRKNRWGQDAATLARSAGHEDVYRLLMERKQPDPSHIVWRREGRERYD